MYWQMPCQRTIIHSHTDDRPSPQRTARLDISNLDQDVEFYFKLTPLKNHMPLLKPAIAQSSIYWPYLFLRQAFADFPVHSPKVYRTHLQNATLQPLEASRLEITGPPSHHPIYKHTHLEQMQQCSGQLCAAAFLSSLLTSMRQHLYISTLISNCI